MIVLSLCFHLSALYLVQRTFWFSCSLLAPGISVWCHLHAGGGWWSLLFRINTRGNSDLCRAARRQIITIENTFSVLQNILTWNTWWKQHESCVITKRFHFNPNNPNIHHVPLHCLKSTCVRSPSPSCHNLMTLKAKNPTMVTLIYSHSILFTVGLILMGGLNIFLLAHITFCSSPRFAICNREIPTWVYTIKHY